MSVQIDGSTGNIIATKADYSGDVSIGGTLTYEDVTNIDSVGLITARNGINVQSAGLTVVGVTTLSSTKSQFDSTGSLYLNSGGSANNGNYLAKVGSDGSADFLSNISIADKIIHYGDTNTAIRFPGNDTFTVETSGSEALRIDGSQRLLMGRTSTVAVANRNSNIQLHSNDASEASITIRRFFDNTGDNAPSRLVLARSGSNSDDSTIVADDNRLGEITFVGADGTDLRTEAANIRAEVDGTPGSDDMPGRLIFSTNAGASDYTERLRITSAGLVGIGEDSPDRLLHLKAASSTAYSGGSDTADYNFLKIENTTNDKSAGIFFQIGGNGEAAITATEVSDGNTDIAFQNRGGGVRSEKLRIDSSGRLLIATSASQGKWNNSSGDDHIVQIESTSAFSQSWISHSTSSTAGVQLDVGRSRGSSDGDTTVVNSGDLLGHLCFQGADGSQFVRGARIAATVDSTPGADDMPTRLTFETTADGASSPTERMRIDNGGNIGIGINNPGDYHANARDLVLANGMTIAHATTAHMYFADSSSGTGEYVGQLNYQHGSDRFQFVVGNTDSFRISGSGLSNYCTATNVDLSNSRSAGTQYEFIYARHSSTAIGNGTLAFLVKNNGNVQNANNSYGSTSDQRLKENIVDATSQWNDIKALQVRKYNFRADTGYQSYTQIGLIAQEVESVSPGLVQTTPVKEGETVLDADGNQLESVKSINYSVLYMKAVKALQEAQTRIETLETKVAALEG